MGLPLEMDALACSYAENNPIGVGSTGRVIKSLAAGKVSRIDNTIRLRGPLSLPGVGGGSLGGFLALSREAKSSRSEVGLAQVLCLTLPFGLFSLQKSSPVFSITFSALATVNGIAKSSVLVGHSVPTLTCLVPSLSRTAPRKVLSAASINKVFRPLQILHLSLTCVSPRH